MVHGAVDGRSRPRQWPEAARRSPNHPSQPPPAMAAVCRCFCTIWRQVRVFWDTVRCPTPHH